MTEVKRGYHIRYLLNLEKRCITSKISQKVDNWMQILGNSKKYF